MLKSSTKELDEGNIEYKINMPIKLKKLDTVGRAHPSIVTLVKF